MFRTPLSSFSAFLRNRSRRTKRIIAMSTDAAICVLAMVAALYLRLNYVPGPTAPLVKATGVSIVLLLTTYWFSGLYRTIFRHFGSISAREVVKATAIYGLIFALIYLVIRADGVPRTIGLLQPILVLAAVIGSRLITRELLYGGAIAVGQERAKNVLIYGAGSAGRQLAAVMQNSAEKQFKGYIDDNPLLIGNRINGSHCYSPDILEQLIDREDIDQIVLAIPGAGRSRRAEISEALSSLPVEVKILPAVVDMIDGKVDISDLRELDIGDLLGRDRVDPDPVLMRANIHGQIVMVTGAGGSIGSELCRLILSYGARKLILVETNEYALYNIHAELLAAANGLTHSIELVPLLASVTDDRRMNAILKVQSPHIIFHSAAYKHVPLVESNPCEGLRNNVLGTFCVAKAAIAHKIPNFVLISTDKAVRPPNIMGASKRMAELVLQGLADKEHGTRFAMVRFGNVLGSSGSVVPLFRAQIAAGGPVTITHREMTRYFMLIPEAAELVIQAGAMAKGGEVFVLDMGPPVKILDLAHKMIELSNLTILNDANPKGDVELLEVGLRPGEKLYEELLIDDNAEGTNHPLIMMARENFVLWEELEPVLAQLANAISLQDEATALTLVCQLVPEYAAARRRNVEIADDDSEMMPARNEMSGAEKDEHRAAVKRAERA